MSQLARRSFLKMLGFLPAYMYFRQAFATPPAPKIWEKLPGDADINLVFHGFFFFEFQDKEFVVASPQYKDHFYRFRDDFDDDLQELPDQVVTFPQLKGASATSADTWLDSILNFSKTAASLQGPLIPTTYSADKFGCLLRLPLPKRILPVRFGGTTDEFTLSGNIAKIIKLPADKQFGLITCLQYDLNSGAKLDFATRHFYGEHCAAPGNTELKAMFGAARTAFGSPFKEAFDLTLTQTSLLKPSLALHKKSLSSLSTLSDDDYNDLAAMRELRYCTHNPCKPFETKADRLTPRERRRILSNAQIMPPLVRTANCPQFGITM